MFHIIEYCEHKIETLRMQLQIDQSGQQISLDLLAVAVLGWSVWSLMWVVGHYAIVAWPRQASSCMAIIIMSSKVQHYIWSFNDIQKAWYAPAPEQRHDI